MFVEALVGWLVSEAGSAGIRTAARAWSGDPLRRALREVCDEAASRAVRRVARPPDQPVLTETLLHAPVLPLPQAANGADPASQISNVVRCWVAPLVRRPGGDGGQDPYLVEIGVDPDQLVEALSTELIAGIREAAVTTPLLHPLASWIGIGDLAGASKRIEATTAATYATVSDLRNSVRCGLSTDERDLPDQLPAAAPLSGRSEELAWLDQARQQARAAGVPALIVITGPAGIGKSALAVSWVRGIVDGVPGGRLFARLHAYDGNEHALPSTLLAEFLRGLGVMPTRIPSDLAGRAELFRTLTSRRPVAVVLDDAASAGQVRPLLPGAAGSLVVVTSRWRLASLATDGGRHLSLGTLDAESATRLMEWRIGTTRVSAEQHEVRNVIRMCGHLPLALCMAAARLATRPKWPVREMVDALAEEHRRLDSLVVDDGTAVRGVLDMSYASLTEDAKRSYRLLAAIPGETVDSPVAAAATGQPAPRCRRDLALLADVNLLDDAPGGQYRYHDLVRLHARQWSRTVDRDGERVAAFDRVVDYRLYVATRAEALLSPSHRSLSRQYREPVTLDPPFHTEKAALSWLEAERGNLMATVRAAVDHRPAAAWQLVDAMWPLFLRRKHYDDWIAAHRIGLAAADTCADETAQARMLTSTGLGFLGARRLTEAQRLFTRALALCRKRQDRRAEAGALNYLGLVARRRGGLDSAQTWFDQSLTAWQATGDKRGTGLVQLNIGELALTRGKLHDAITHLTQAHDVLTDTGDSYEAARALALLGDTRARARVDGVTELQQALAAFDELGSTVEQAHTLEMLGDAAARIGNRGAARIHYGRARSLYAASDVPTERVDHVDARLAAIGP